MIKIRGLSKIYGVENTPSAVIALDNVDIDIQDGEFVGIVGESGSGKSTLLNLIGALDKPSNGSIEIDGNDIAKFNEKQSADFRRNNIGFIFQDFFLDSDFSVQQNVEIPLMLKGMDKVNRAKIAQETLVSLGLESKMDKKISELSGGQKQRVCIARALVNNAKIILADEPTGNLDTKNGKAVIEHLKSLCEKGITVILVTHNMQEAQNCDRLIKLEDGKVVD